MAGLTSLPSPAQVPAASVPEATRTTSVPPAPATATPHERSSSAMTESTPTSRGVVYTREKLPDAGDSPTRRGTVLHTDRKGNPAAIHHPTPQGSLPERMNMYVGEIRVLPLKHIDIVAVGSGKVVSTTVVHKDHDLMVLAEDPGESSLYVWDKAGNCYTTQIRVDGKDVARIQREVTDALAGLTSEVKVSRVGSKVIVTGSNLSNEASHLVAEVVKNYPEVTNLTSGANAIDKNFADMIRFDLKFLEVKRSAENDLGVSWDTQTSGGLFFGLLDDVFMNKSGGFRVIPSDSSTTDWENMSSNKSTKWYFGSSFTLGSVINLMVSKGDAYVLAAPSLTTRRGGKAKFLAGGEIPLTAVSSNGATSITYKQYGIMLNIDADWTPESTIAGSVMAEVSSVDESVTVQGNPGFLTRRTENQFSLHDGDTIVLSGLINKEASKTVDKLPVLGDLPILGAFFKNTDDTDKDNELLVFITPHLVQPDAPLNVDTLNHGVKGFNRQSRKVNGKDVLTNDGGIIPEVEKEDPEHTEIPVKIESSEDYAKEARHAESATQEAE